MTSQTAPTQPGQYNPAEVRRTLEIFCGDDPAEIRILNAYGSKSRTDCGYFDDFGRAAGMLAAYAHNPRNTGIYFTLNQFPRDLMLRASNRFQERIDSTVTDADITRRKWLFIDVDPKRPAGISSSAEEHEAAKHTAAEVARFLHSTGWPQPIICSSGNGWHLNYGIDAPNTEPVKRAIHQALRALDGRFSTAGVSIDTKVFNAARICKLYGTVARKGDHSPNRPHRTAEIVRAPSELQVVSWDLVSQLAAEAPATASSKTAKPKTPQKSRRSGKGTADPVDRARAYIAKIPGAVSGEHGHNAAFHVACVLVKSFGLPIDDARTLLEEWNLSCEPPWSPSELEHKLQSASEAPGPEGELLTADRQQNSNPSGPNAAAAGHGDGDEAVNADPRPKVIVDHDEHETANAVLQTLGQAPVVFVMNEKLGRLYRRDDGTLAFLEFTEASLREAVVAHCQLIDMEGERKHPPRWLLQGILSRPVFAAVRTLRGVKCGPILRNDGSICAIPGYDARSKYILDFDPGEWPEIKSNPSPEDAQAELEKLLDIVADFPFDGEQSRAAWVAYVLALIGREYIAERVPCFAFDAPTAGSGKSLLNDLANIIALGKTAPKTTFPSDENELRKKLFSAAIETPQPLTLCFDNLPAGWQVKGAAIEAYITSDYITDRALGRSKNLRARADMVLSLTGNNISLSVDMRRRTIRCRLEPQTERPEDRGGFRIPDIRAHVRANWKTLHVAGLTILAAFEAAGRPGDSLRVGEGSFERFSDTVRKCCVWLGLADPMALSATARAEVDPDTEALKHFVASLEFCDPHGRGLRASDMLDSARGVETDSETSGVMAGGLEALTGQAIKDLTSRKLGKELSSRRRKVVGNLLLTSRTKRGETYWFVTSVAESGGSETGSGGLEIDFGGSRFAPNPPRQTDLFDEKPSVFVNQSSDFI
jgi:hypothetical protein